MDKFEKEFEDLDVHSSVRFCIVHHCAVMISVCYKTTFKVQVFCSLLDIFGLDFLLFFLYNSCLENCNVHVDKPTICRVLARCGSPMLTRQQYIHIYIDDMIHILRYLG